MRAPTHSIEMMTCGDVAEAAEPNLSSIKKRGENTSPRTRR